MLSVEPYGMKLRCGAGPGCGYRISVLSVEPYGMKPAIISHPDTLDYNFSALGRAVWDETQSVHNV